MIRYDVIAVNQETHEERVLATDKSRKDANAIVSMAVARRGVEDEFFKKVPHRSKL